MIVYHFCTAVNEANAYLLIDTDSGECLLVDVPAWTEGMQKILNEHNAKLVGVFITHEHYDHTSGLNGLYKQHPNIRKYPSREFFNNPEDEKHNKLTVGKWEGKILYLPGHTPDSVGLHIGNVIFTGDALFAGSVGGTISPREAKQQVDALRKRVLILPENTLVLTGHGPASSVGIEKRYNPFLKEGSNIIDIF